MNTTDLGIASIDGTNSVIIAISRDIVSNMITSLYDITEIMSASISVITTDQSMDT